jgi:hypothetical protein
MARRTARSTCLIFALEMALPRGSVSMICFRSVVICSSLDDRRMGDARLALAQPYVPWANWRLSLQRREAEG